MRDNVRKISQGSGTKVDSAVEGLKLLAQGKEINYEGASGPCDFNEIGDILGLPVPLQPDRKGQDHVPEGPLIRRWRRSSPRSRSSSSTA